MAGLLGHLGVKPEHVAVEVNKDAGHARRHAETRWSRRRRAGGRHAGRRRRSGRGRCDRAARRSARHTIQSRLLVGTGKYATLELMRDCLEASGAEVVTVAVRRERLFDREGRNLLDFLDPRRYTILPNTAGCFSAEDALRTARLGRELLEGLDNPGADWVKLEVLADPRTLLPDPRGHARSDRGAGQGGVPGPLLHQRRPDHGPPAQGGRGDQRDAGRQPDRQRAGGAEPEQHPDHPRGPEGGRPGLSR